MHTASKTSIKITCSMSELSSQFFIKSISERSRDTKEELILLLALQMTLSEENYRSQCPGLPPFQRSTSH